MGNTQSITLELGHMKYWGLMMMVGMLVGCEKNEAPEPQMQLTEGELALTAKLSRHNPMNDKRLHWAFKNNQIFSSAPAIGPDGTVYVGSWDKRLYAIDGKTGNKQWEFETKDRVRSSPTIGPDGTIYIGSSDKNLYALNSDGTQKWVFETEGEIYTSPSLDAKGTVYLAGSDQKVYAFDEKTGVKKWALKMASRMESAPVIGEDGTIYVGARDKFYSINSKSGKMLWEFETGGWSVKAPVIGNGNIYFSDGSRFFALDEKTGNKKWGISNENKASFFSPSLAVDGTIYVGSGEKLYALNPDGSKRWEFTAGSNVASTPVIGADDTIYIAIMNDRVCAINPDGSIKWEFGTWFVNCELASPALDADGILYINISGKQGILYAIKTDSKGPAKSPWPMFGQNAQRTGLAVK